MSLPNTADGDFERIWVEHCEDEACLDEYAYAMQHLATEHWATKHPDDRIKWCYHVCKEFFIHGGLGKALEKDRRKRQHKLSKLQHHHQHQELMSNNGGQAIVPNGNHSNGNHGGVCENILECAQLQERKSNQYNTM